MSAIGKRDGLDHKEENKLYKITLLSFSFMIDKEHVLEVVRMKGLVVPSDLIRDFRTDTFIIGAVLSDLVHEKKLNVTAVKIGGSPVYYPPEQKEKIQDLFRYLNEKDKTTYELLKQQKVLSDTEQTPIVRVSLRNITSPPATEIRLIRSEGVLINCTRRRTTRPG